WPKRRTRARTTITSSRGGSRAAAWRANSTSEWTTHASARIAAEQGLVENMSLKAAAGDMFAGARVTVSRDGGSLMTCRQKRQRATRPPVREARSRDGGIQPTPLRGDKIPAILTAGFCNAVLPIYWCGAAEARDVRRLIIHQLLCHTNAHNEVCYFLISCA